MRTTPRTSTRKLIAALCLGAALAPASAGAQDDEVFVDPDSPAGREYSIPSEEARDRAAPGSGGGDRGGGGGSGSNAFGAGVGDGSGGGGGGSAGGSGGDSGGGSSSDERSSGGLPATDEARRALEAAASQPAPEGGSDTVLAIIGSGALVLALAAGAGAALRRRRA